MNKLFMDIHILQTLPPSCVNRDDTDSPKTAVYGGVTRARVSSQAWKKAMRDYFREHIVDGMEVAIRIKNLVKPITKELTKRNISDKEAAIFAEEIVKLLLNIKDEDENKDNKDGEKKEDEKNKNKKEKNKNTNKEQSQALFLITEKQIRSIADLAEHYKDKKPKREEIINACKVNHGIDEALFGRMAAQVPTINTEAAAQVAHSISTHRVFNEYDYFTALEDDINGYTEDKDHAGAGYIGTTEFNSATLYRYATVAIHELYGHLGDKAALAVAEFFEAFTLSMPNGKKNSFANNTLPFTVFVCLRKDMPVNLVGAFEKPVLPGKNGFEGYEQTSLEALISHFDDIHNDWLSQPEKKFYCGRGGEQLGVKMSLPDLRDAILKETEKFVLGGAAQ